VKIEREKRGKNTPKETGAAVLQGLLSDNWLECRFLFFFDSPGHPPKSQIRADNNFSSDFFLLSRFAARLECILGKILFSKFMY